MEHLGNGIEVGQKIMIDGRTYWVTEISNDRIGFMLDPDSQPRKESPKKGSFWPIFWTIILSIVLIKLVF